jgi:hypothetical protein
VTTFVYPAPDDEPWPTLGPEVCAFIEAEFCHGPGDLLGRPVRLSDEQRAWIFRMYEVHPPTLERRQKRVIVKTPNPIAGKRRFQRCALSLRKGSSKTEFAAWIAGAELHPDGPVRCAGFKTVRGEPRPIPRGVVDPYIPMISYTEEQTEELAYGALRRILEECTIGRDFDIGLERIMRRRGDGKAEAVSASPNSRDGARTTFEHADETHRFTLQRMKNGWSVMLANLAKRPLADPWALETTTAPEPGLGSVAETTMQHAQTLAKKPGGGRMFFFHRQASDALDITTDAGLRAAVVEASGPYIAAWSDIDRIVEQFHAPDAERMYLERVWLNRLVQRAGTAFNVERWRELSRERVVPARAPITLGFDGSRFDDDTALVATEVGTGHQWPLGVWHPKDGAIDVQAVAQAVTDAFTRYQVVRMYCDPPKWEGWVARWMGTYGDKRVVEFWTNRPKPMAYALRAYRMAMTTGELTHNGDPTFARHIAQSYRQDTGLEDDEQKPLWVIRKERPDSPMKIDAAMAGCLSWEARNDAIAAGEGKPSVYETRGLVEVEL